MLRIALLACSIGISTAAFADPAAMTRLRQEYDNCVYGAVGEQWKSNPKLLSSIAAETAFAACATEEQAIMAYLYGSSVNPSTATTAMIAVKAQLKRTVREIMADPAQYIRRNGG